ncbi:MAG: hypothetical protein ACRD2W_22420 [Acidimicrobiales bacterium]
MHNQVADVDLVAADQAVMGVLQAGGAGGDHVRASGGELAAAGDEVGVQVGLGGDRDPQARRSASAKYGAESRAGSTTIAVPSPRSTR